MRQGLAAADCPCFTCGGPRAVVLELDLVPADQGDYGLPQARPESTAYAPATACLIKTGPDQDPSTGRKAHWTIRSGATTYELARRFGANRETISRQLKHAGVRMRGQALSAADVDRAEQLYATGLSLAKVGRELGCAASNVGRALKVRAVRFRSPNQRRKL